ncbi:MAG: ubiquinol oxidase subunit II [Firmicutes bacterium]|nr:ubiquinol oxidase subunit II [Melghirimyces thermohalophilus]MDA8351657.1 ubiquinol oxidase subunit II [Bacillota bacterium]
MRRSSLGKMLLLAVPFLLTGCRDRFLVLDPAGPVAETEYNMIVLSAVLISIVVIPVIGLLIYIVRKYRDRPGNDAPYQPEWADSKRLEIVWWGIPIVIIAVLSVFTVRDTFALTQPPSDQEPVTIQVTSLDWKWMFQYPESGVATVNYAKIPAGVPVQFVLTSDAPMNSFWVPQLGGQTYTMPGMAMRMWLQADQPGTYYGHGANFTGKEFAKMEFDVIAEKPSEFKEWTKQVKESKPKMTKEDYKQLKEPGVVEEKTFSSYPSDLFKEIVMKNGGIYRKEEHQHILND